MVVLHKMCFLQICPVGNISIWAGEQNARTRLTKQEALHAKGRIGVAVPEEDPSGE
jgi:hypothetical protein